MEAYGFANRCLSEITAEMMGNEDLLKFLYYTDNEEEDFLANEKPTADKIINKHKNSPYQSFLPSFLA